ncbi:MAG: hypothetical protein AB7I50_14535 [Vicinamibacterales bacterium]
MRDRGFSLVDVITGLAMLSVAVAALAPVFLQTTLGLAGARIESLAVAAALSRLEQLSALAFEEDSASAIQVTDESTNLASSPPDASGTGLRRVGTSPLLQPRNGLADWIDSTGSPIATPRGRVVLGRRWSVSSLPRTADGEGLLLHVTARGQAREAGEGRRTTFARRPGDVWLFSVRARSLR